MTAVNTRMHMALLSSLPSLSGIPNKSATLSPVAIRNLSSKGFSIPATHLQTFHHFTDSCMQRTFGHYLCNYNIYPAGWDSSGPGRPADDDFEAADLSEEDETVILSGEGFTAEELAAAETRLQDALVSHDPKAPRMKLKMGNTSQRRLPSLAPTSPAPDVKSYIEASQTCIKTVKQLFERQSCMLHYWA